MKNKILFLPFVAIALLSCSERDLGEKDAQTGPYELTHEMIVLGDRMEDPYSLENMNAALASVYPTKAGRVDLQATDIYVRFLPKDQEEYRMLLNSGLVLFDHPIDYQIIKDGDYYHDPELPEDKITWQYAVVRPDFDFPSRIRYEILDQCYIADNDPAVRSGGDIDWDLVEREAYRISGNEELILPDPKALSAVDRPSGRITVYDEDGNDVPFEFLDLIEYESNEYVVLLPADDGDADEVVILKVEESQNEDEESYVGVEDQAVLDAVFRIFKDKFKDEFNFVD